MQATKTKSEGGLWEKIVEVWRRVQKVLMRLLSGLSELERMVYYTVRGQNRWLEVNRVIRNSRVMGKEAIAMIESPDGKLEELIELVVVRKKLENVEADGSIIPFMPRLKQALGVEMSFSALKREMNGLKVKYDSEDPHHEALLEQLWIGLTKTKTRQGGRFTDAWGDIGFQGKDPATDFRGMGVLSLHAMLHLISRYPLTAEKLYESSIGEYPWFFAITSINFVATTVELTNSGLIRSALYSQLEEGGLEKDQKLTMGHWYEVWIELMNRFNDAWIEAKPENIMAFGEVRRQVEDKVKEEMKNRTFSIRLVRQPGLGGPGMMATRFQKTFLEKKLGLNEETMDADRRGLMESLEVEEQDLGGGAGKLLRASLRSRKNKAD